MKKYVFSLILIGICLIIGLVLIVGFFGGPLEEYSIMQNAKLTYGSKVGDIEFVDRTSDFDFLFEDLSDILANDAHCVLMSVNNSSEKFMALLGSDGSIIALDYISLVSYYLDDVFESNINTLMRDVKGHNLVKNLSANDLRYSVSVDYNLTDNFSYFKSSIFDDLSQKSSDEIYDDWLNSSEQFSLPFYPVINIGIIGNRGDFDAFDISMDICDFAMLLSTMDNHVYRPFALKVYYTSGDVSDCCFINFTADNMEPFYTNKILNTWLEM